MSEQQVLHLIQQTLWMTLQLSLPILVTGLLVGLAVGILQSVTQIHEMTLTFIPKILAVALVLVVALPWMMQELLSFTREVFDLSTKL
ncbi:MAG: flagellar biosynthesis protein FliQ [bacterium]|jgi:flagellar biosynthetic protein FliQ|nr:flagellar biosynthesis protein FliQ [bacterium]